MQQLQGAEPSALPTTTTRSLYDVKAMQKEAVLSYVKVMIYVHALVYFVVHLL